MKKRNGSNPKKVLKKAHAKEKRARRKVKLMAAVDKKLKSLISRLNTMQEIITIQEQEITSLKTPAPKEDEV